MEGEPAPPDPSSDEDDEPRVGRGRGRGAKSGSAPKANAPKSVKSAKVTPVSADAVSIGLDTAADGVALFVQNLDGSLVAVAESVAAAMVAIGLAAMAAPSLKLRRTAWRPMA